MQDKWQVMRASRLIVFVFAVSLVALAPFAAAAEHLVYGSLTSPGERPLAGATVVATALPEGRAGLASAKSDAGGLYELMLPAEGYYRLLVEAAGFLPKEICVLVYSPEPTSVAPYELQPAGSAPPDPWIDPAPPAAAPGEEPWRRLRGRVTTVGGEPVEGAWVAALGFRWPLYTRSDAAGRFEIASPPVRGLQQVEAFKAGYRRGVARASQPRDDLAIELEPAAAVAGRVVALDGRPVGGAEVLVMAGADPRGFNATHSDVSRQDGGFCVTDLPAGERVWLKAKAYGLESPTIAIRTAAGERATVELVIPLRREKEK